MFTSILYNSHFLKYCETRHHHVVFFQDIEETEAFGGLDSCSGVKCTGAGLLGLGTYDWKTLGCVSVKRTYCTNLPKNRGSYHRCTSFVFFLGGFLEKENMEIHEFLGSSWNQTSRFRLRDGGKGQLTPETALRYLCTPALPCLGDVKAPPLLKPGVSWFSTEGLNRWQKKGEGTQKMAETHTIFDSFGLVLMLVGGKKLK